MEYVIDIIDTEQQQTLSLENAAASSLVLRHKGNDNINENFIVGSSFDFTLLSQDECNAPVFIDLLTKNELRYQVQVNTNETTPKRVWTGHLLPDLYSEPYEGAVTPVQFTATDGLARLKGKFLPDDFYREDKSVMQIIGACLKLTGLVMEINFDPAIKATKKTGYYTIFIDTAKFNKNDKKDDAYVILEGLMKSMLCSIYQKENTWKIEGFNAQMDRVHNYTPYDYDNNFQHYKQEIRQLKQPEFLNDPLITSVVPYGNIVINSENNPIELPEGLTEIKNNGWSTNDVPLLVSEWEKIQNQNYPFIPLTPNINDIVANSSDGKPYIDKNEWYHHIKNRPYLTPGIYKFTLKLDAKGDKDGDNQETWINNIHYYSVIYTSDTERNIIGSNQSNSVTANQGYIRTDLDFTEDDSLEISYLFNVYQGGFFDVILYAGAVFESAIGMEKIEISDVSLELQEFEDELVSRIENDGWTQTKEVDLDISSDPRGVNKAFKLAKTNVPTDYKSLKFDVLRKIQIDGKWHLSMDLNAVRLIDKYYPNGIMVGGQLLNFEVKYNYLESFEHFLVIEPPFGQNILSITVNIPVFDNIDYNRADWGNWADRYYPIEAKNYSDVVASVYNRLQDKTVFAMNDAEVRGEVMMGDFVVFDYPTNSEPFKPWAVKSVVWDMDKGICKLGLREAYYNLDLMVVELGDDIFIDSGSPDVTIKPSIISRSSTSFTYLWEETTGMPLPPGLVLTNRNLIIDTATMTDNYNFKLTVTDNNGLTASDTIGVYNYDLLNISLPNISTAQDYFQYSGIVQTYAETIDEIDFTPNIKENTYVLVGINYNLYAYIKSGLSDAYCYTRIIIKLNGSEVLKRVLEITVNNTFPVTEKESSTLKALVTKGDVVTIEIKVYVQGYIGNNEDLPSLLARDVYAEYDIVNPVFKKGYGEIIGAPIHKGRYLQWLPA